MTRHSTSDKGTRSAPAIVGGCRTPFIKSNGAFATLISYELGRFAVNALLDKTGLKADIVQALAMGTVISDPRTSNVAREVVLSSALPNTVPAHTVTMACISSNMAATSIADMIRLRHIEVGIAGGCETFSDPPIRVSRRVRMALAKASKAKGVGDYLRLLRTLSLADLRLDFPSPTEFSTNETMGQGCERMAKQLGISREESDRFAQRSHALAGKAWSEGKYDIDVVAVDVPPHFHKVSRDDGPRPNSTSADLAKLKPAFDAEFGVVTAASSSFFTDGASAVLLMSDALCQKLSQKPLAHLIDYVYAASDPLHELLFGPARTIPSLLERNGLKVADIDVWELHEAFAAQVLANLKFLAPTIGEIPMDKLNLWGGSLSLGHPFGATGGRLLLTAAKRLEAENGRFAVVSGCAAGGLGSAILLERP